MDKNRVNIRYSSGLPIYLTLGLLCALLFLSILQPLLTYMFTNLLAVGLAIGITSFSLLMRVLTKNNTLDIIGAGMFVVAIFITATVVAIISPSLLFDTTHNLADQLWAMTLLFESITLVLSAANKRTHAKFSFSWTAFPIFGLCALMLVYYDLPISYLFFKNHVTLLGASTVFAACFLFCLTIAIAQRKRAREVSWWTNAITTAAVLFLLSIASAFLFKFNIHLRAIGTIFHFGAFYVLFFSVLNNIVLDPLKSVFVDISAEKNRYARWDSLSQFLLDFNENIAFVNTISELQAQAFKTLRGSFNSDFVAFIQLTPKKEIRYMASPLFREKPILKSSDLAKGEEHLRSIIGPLDDNHFSFTIFAVDYLDEPYRFFVCPFIIGKENQGYLVTGKHTSIMQEDPDIRERFFAQFSEMIALSLKSMRLESERILREKNELAMTNRIAQTLQDAIIPLKDPDIGNSHVLLAPFLHAAPGLAKIGGDFYDAFCIHENLIGFSIGDISGHGIDAAAYNAMIRSSIRALGLQEFDPAYVMSATNHHIFSEFNGLLFATAVFGTLETDTGHVEMCIAGHPLPVIVQDGQQRIYSSVQNPMLGFIEDFAYQCFSFELAPNESIALYTDGLTEARNSDGEEFGRDRLISILVNKRGDTPQESVRALFSEVDAYCGAREPHDDRTILVVRWSG